MKVELRVMIGILFIERFPNVLVPVEPIDVFLERTPADKDRALRAALARAEMPSTTVH